MKGNEMKKDKELEKLFDAYADGVKPDGGLCDRAKSHMRAKSGRMPPRRIFAIASSLCCAAVVLAVSFAVLFPALKDGFFGGSSMGGVTADPDSVAPLYYAAADIKGRNVSYDDVKNYVDINVLKEHYKVAGEKYSAFYFKDSGKTAFINMRFAVETEDGVVEIDLVAETAKNVYGKFKDCYETGSGNFNGSLLIGTRYENGEYISNAYFADSECRYYVSAMSGSGRAEEIISMLFS